jgi:DNA-directed RNA polymerase specialized sigma24 family protein
MSESSVIVEAARERERLFIALYEEAFPVVARYNARRGGSFEDAKDVFQDALVLYYEQAVIGSVSLRRGPRAYLMGIARHLWLQRHRTRPGTTPLDPAGPDLPAADADDEAPSPATLLRYLETAGRRCMDLLRAFYYDRLPMAGLAEAFGYASVRSATVQKYKCLEKVRDTVKQEALTYADFLE